MRSSAFADAVERLPSKYNISWTKLSLRTGLDDNARKITAQDAREGEGIQLLQRPGAKFAISRVYSCSLPWDTLSKDQEHA